MRYHDPNGPQPTFIPALPAPCDHEWEDIPLVDLFGAAMPRHPDDRDQRCSKCGAVRCTLKGFQ